MSAYLTDRAVRIVFGDISESGLVEHDTDEHGRIRCGTPLRPYAGEVPTLLELGEALVTCGSCQRCTANGTRP